MLFNWEAIRQHCIHFIGIGGIGMSGIAEILLNLGYTVTGSDMQDSAVTVRLREIGATVHIGHCVENIGAAEAVVASSAIPESNPELMEAHRLRVPVISRGELLAELMRVKYGIAVAGSHGKTSTSSICASVLGAGKKDPTVVIGGRVVGMGSNARLGSGDYLLVESDESDGSFLQLAPIIAVITNIDREHMDHYGSLEVLFKAFVQFANNVPFYGTAIVCLDDPLARQVASQVRRRCCTYGLKEVSPDAELVADDIELSRGKVAFRLAHKGVDLGCFQVQGIGLHTVRNAMAAVLVGLEINIPVDEIRHGLDEFLGVDRRFQKRGEYAGITVIDDYGHHPTEIRTTLAAVVSCGFRSVNVVFQPHRYSRTKLLESEFATCFQECDRLWVVDIYAASENPLPGINSPRLVEKISESGHPCASYSPSIQDAVEQALDIVKQDELLITFGAGNIWMAGVEFLEKLRNRGNSQHQVLVPAPPGARPYALEGREP